WSRLGPYAPRLLESLLAPERAILEYWAHAASILPMSDYPYHRAWMLHHAAHMWAGNREWSATHPEAIRDTLETVRVRGPLASADFERPDGIARSGPWDWHGPKPSRRALEILWTTGDLMVHSRRGGQKLYDVRQRVLAEAFGAHVPRDQDLPSLDERRRYLASRTVRALGVVVPTWLWDYFRLSPPAGAGKRAAALAQLQQLERDGSVVPATVEGIAEPAFVRRELLPVLDRLRAGDRPARTTLLSPFDNLIWDRLRTRMLFDYEVCFEAYVAPAKRRYGYYCMAILHGDRLVGRIDPKMDRANGVLLARALYLEPGVQPDDALLDGLSDALLSLGRFLGATTVHVEPAGQALLAEALSERLTAYRHGIAALTH
ncbi:MAG TPA: crosslink repair DNA glycosylase YcaQ family protein, partial [Chloroflexota bacterium]|nr:crosslink repair DNA glycosylase YcaQ family protein [Chloroflexota bacterium]